METKDKTTLAHGVFVVEHYRDGKLLDKQVCPNMVVSEGLDYILNVSLNGSGVQTQINPWYLGIFDTNYTIQSTDAASNIHSRSSESSAYTEATRVQFSGAAASANAVTNSANKATFTMNATTTIYGCFLVSASSKTATTGTLISSAKFTNARSVIANDELLVTYTLTAADA